MTKDNLIKAIIELASVDDPVLVDNASISFWIDIQPNSLSYGGEFQVGEDENKPIDLKKIGKANCNSFADLLQRFHRDSTDNGRNKWNRARIKRESNGTTAYDFQWDQEWEEIEAKGYMDSESERGKWYWEEK